MASKIDVPDEIVDVRIMKRTLRATIVDLICVDSVNERDWRSSVIQSSNQPSSNVAKDLRKFIVVSGELIIEAVLEC